MKKFATMALMMAMGLGFTVSSETVKEKYYGSEANSKGTNPCKGECTDICYEKETIYTLLSTGFTLVTVTEKDIYAQAVEKNSYVTNEAPEKIIDRIINNAPANAVVTIISDDEASKAN